ncbi:MAG: DUF5011 domain-containing protein, partial [Chitinivibrionales bacterium]|nr:DUF5011 domain-containing protein [Chitinivibrionales bacterium]
DNPFDPHGKNYVPPEVKAMDDTVVALNRDIVLHAKASARRGWVQSVRWYFRQGSSMVLDSVETDSTAVYTRKFSRLQLGRNQIVVRAINNLGIFSFPDTFIVDVRLYPPTIRPVADTMVRLSDSPLIRVQADDSNSGRSIVKYYWRWQGSEWNDSTEQPQHSFSSTTGGVSTIVWGCRDDDSTIVTDTFTIYYNQPPSSVGMSDPADSGLAQFIQFDKTKGKGTISLHYRAKDPDSALTIETITYTLLVGTDPMNLLPAYVGKDTVYKLENCDTTRTYYWKLSAADFLAQTITTQGKFRTVSIDLTPPVVTIKGENPIRLSQYQQYKEPGATAIDNVDGDISKNIVISGDSINTSIPGTFNRIYTVTDAMQNSDTAMRAVIVDRYIIVEDFEDNIPYQTTFGALWGAPTSDSIGCWRARTDKFIGGKTYFQPDPYQNPATPFQDVIKTDGGNTTKGINILVFIDKNIKTPRYELGLYLKKKSVYYDLSGMDSMVVEVRGDEVLGPIRVQFSDPHIDSLSFDKQWGYVGVDISIDLTWRKFVIKPVVLNGLKDSPGEGLTWESVKKNISMIRFVNPSGEFYNQAILIDNIKLYGDFRNSGLAN